MRGPPGERLPRLSNAWYDDETGLWDGNGAPTVKGDWDWPRGPGPNSAFLGVYEFLHTSGSFKAHFWARQRWEAAADHVDPLLRAELDTLLLGLVWDGMDGEAEHADPGLFSDGPGYYGVLLARTPDSVREPRESTDLLEEWGNVLNEAARRSWCVVGLSA
ncbi:hypothetical protein [Streptomyces sp. TRM70350]|uniref:hypothetical protein n=1 Tax=Streptomyces sp. TRM70350 TaxID=2856165 RepID=UPI001C43EBBD|nr:hypothetical protein [Streptomyces sp. TRM70350]MBV7701047.1 hypothetical protein [Streptomyces sp. TRM70350]